VSLCMSRLRGSGCERVLGVYIRNFKIITVPMDFILLLEFSNNKALILSAFHHNNNHVSTIRKAVI